MGVAEVPFIRFLNRDCDKSRFSSVLLINALIDRSLKKVAGYEIPERRQYCISLCILYIANELYVAVSLDKLDAALSFFSSLHPRDDVSSYEARILALYFHPM